MAMKGLLHLSVVVFVCIWSALYFEDVSCLSIDEIILEADQDAGMNMDLNQDDGTVLVELDIRYKREDWQEIQQLNSESGSDRHKRKAIRSTARRWTNNAVPYRLSNVFSRGNLGQIQSAFDEWERYTCLDFRPARSNDRNYVYLQNGGGCSSYVGMQGGSQPVSLAPGCRVKSVIVHELGHAIGFQHEQTRPDRDQYVTVYYQNIQRGTEFNFQRYTTATVNDFSVPYDYRSVMHYGATAFSVNGQYTIRTRDTSFQNVIGNAAGLSFRDIKLANLMYNCNGACATKSCPGEGFVGKDCNCWCPGSPVTRCNGDGDDDDDDDEDEGGDGDCEDTNASCSYWASIGECSKNPDYMLKQCKNSCQVCDDDDGGSEDCVDGHANCEYWASTGECSRYRDYMRENCRKSCQVCTVTGGGGTNSCKDKDMYCGYWSTAGYCSSFRAFMMENCAVSCNTCGQSQPTAECRDNDLNCHSWSVLGECRSNPQHMLINCASSCGMCSR